MRTPGSGLTKGSKNFKAISALEKWKRRWVRVWNSHRILQQKSSRRILQISKRESRGSLGVDPVFRFSLFPLKALSLSNIDFDFLDEGFNILLGGLSSLKWSIKALKAITRIARPKVMPKAARHI